MSLSQIRETVVAGWRALRGTAATNGLELLVVSADDRFYSSVLYTATLLSWRATWVRSIERGLDAARANPDLIVLLDASMAPATWAWVLKHFSICRPDTCVVLAVEEATDEVWNTALKWGAYDVVCRRIDAKHFAATACFASHWRRNVRCARPAEHRERVTGYALAERPGREG